MFIQQRRYLNEHEDGGDLPGSDSPENTTGSDSQESSAIDWKSRAEEAEKRAQNKAAAAKRQGEKIAKLEAQLAELGKSYQGEPENTDDKAAIKRELQRLQEKHSKELQELQAQRDAALEQLNSGKKQATLEKLVSQYVDPEMVDVFMSAYGSKFEFVDGELEVGGLPPTSFIEQVLEQKPKFKPAPRKGIGVAGENTGKGGIQKITLAEFNKLGDKARNEFAALVSEGKAKVI